MAKFSLEDLNSMYVDVLREIGNIGAGNATTAIAGMLQLRLDMKVPQVKFLSLQEVPTAMGAEEDLVCGIFLEVKDDISGSMMFLLDMDSAHYLVNLLMGKDPSNQDEFSEMELSALQEIGNIIAASYLSAVASLTGMRISPSVPYICIDMAAAILSVPAIEFGQYGEHALMIETQFGDSFHVNGHFILLPDLESYDKILGTLGLL